MDAAQWPVFFAHFGLLLLLLTLLPGVAHAGRVERFKLTAPDAAQSSAFGRSVDLIGNTAIVGSYSTAAPPGGTAYLFDITSGEQLFELQPSGSGSAEGFGQTVAISETWAVVGAPFDDELGAKAGAAYVFDVASGQQVRKLTASDAEERDVLGFSLAIDGDLAIIGAWGDDDRADRSGAAYVFDVSTGEELLKLTASDAMAEDRFSSSVAISGTRAIVGTFRSDKNFPGAVYIFDIDTGQERFQLTGPAQLGRDQFGGDSVAISGNVAAVGAPSDSEQGSNAGAAYVFDAVTGDELHKLTASDAMAYARFGVVALDEHRLVVGATGAIPGRIGAAYVFDAGSGAELLKLWASDGAPGDFFGRPAISGNRVIIGATGVDGVVMDSGAAYVFFIPEPSSEVLAMLAILGLAAYLAGCRSKKNTNRGFTF